MFENWNIEDRRMQAPFALHLGVCRMDDGYACTCKPPFPLLDKEADEIQARLKPMSRESLEFMLVDFIARAEYEFAQAVGSSPAQKEKQP